MNLLNTNIFKDSKRAKSDEERKLWTVMKSYRMMKKVTRPFFFFFFFLFLSNVFFKLFSWIKLQMLLRCCLIHVTFIIVRHFLYLLYFCSCLDLGLFMSHLCHLFFIFIFIMIDHIISRMQTHLCFCLFSRICPVIFGWRMWIIFQLAKVQGVT